MPNQYPKHRRNGQTGKWMVGMIFVIGLIGLGLIVFFR